MKISAYAGAAATSTPAPPARPPAPRPVATRPGTGWVGFSNIMMAKDFVCTHCLEDARLAKSVHDRISHNMSAALTSGATTTAKVKARADCVAPKYIAEFKAHPHVYEEQGNWNRAAEKCPGS